MVFRKRDLLMFKQNENGKVSKVKSLSTTASPAEMRIKDSQHGTEHNSKGRSFLFLSPHLSLSSFCQEHQYNIGNSGPIHHHKSAGTFPLSQRMEESEIQILRLRFDELCWRGSSQPEASSTFPSIEYVASLNMVLTQGRCVTSLK